MDDLDLITVAEAAEMAGYTPTTIYKWLDQGWVKAHRFGKLRLIPKAPFVAFIATYVPKPGPRSSKMGITHAIDGNVTP